MRYLRELSPRMILRLLPLRRRVRSGRVGGPLDGLNCWLLFLRWEIEHGERSEWPLDEATALRLRGEIMERIRSGDV